MVVCEYDEMDLMDLVGAARLKAKTFGMLLMSDYILDFWYSQQQQHHVTQLSAKTLFKDKRVHEFTMLNVTRLPSKYTLLISFKKTASQMHVAPRIVWSTLWNG